MPYRPLLLTPEPGPRVGALIRRLEAHSDLVAGGARQRAAVGGVVAGQPTVQIPDAQPAPTRKGHGFSPWPWKALVAGGGFEPPTFGL